MAHSRLNSHSTFGKMIRTWLRLLPLLLLIACSILLLEGLPILNDPVLKGSGLPFELLITWVGIIMLPLSIVVGIRILRKPISPVYRFYHRAFLLLALSASFWGLLSNLLAGNWAFTFSNTDRFEGSEQAFLVFRYYTAIIISLTIFLLIVFGTHHLIIKMKKK